MFEIIKTQKIFNLTCYKVKTSYSITWIYFKNGCLQRLEDAKFYKRTKSILIPLFGLPPQDLADLEKLNLI